MGRGVLTTLLLTTSILCLGSSQLSSNFYEALCPQALSFIRQVVEEAISGDPHAGPALLRLHFQDCFVNGCDASLLLDDTPHFVGEKTARENLNSLRGFEVVDKIKQEVDKACGGSIVSCADILAVSARDAVVHLGGPSWEVPLGRRDSLTASKEAANEQIPSPYMNLQQLISNFESHGLDLWDLATLSGAHTVGFARCTTFRDRIYNETSLMSFFTTIARRSCPSSEGDNNLMPLDIRTPMKFDANYFRNLREGTALLHSDHELFAGGSADLGVMLLQEAPESAFFDSFARSMVKVGSIRPLTGRDGEVRVDRRKRNSVIDEGNAAA